MKRRLFAAGIVTPIMFFLCGGTMLLAALFGWFWLGQESSARHVRIAFLPPLKTPVQEIATPSAWRPTDTVIQAGQPAQDVPLPTATSSPPKTPTMTTSPQPVATVLPTPAKTRLLIARLGLETSIIPAPLQDQSWQVDHLGWAVGHLQGTALPGSNSNLVLAGHINLPAGQAGPFANLGQLSPGDEIVVIDGQHKFVYEVHTRQIVGREAIEVTFPSTTAQITLITCNNWNPAENRYVERLVVKGSLKN